MAFGSGFLIDVLLLSVASGTLALTLTYSSITKPLRHRFMGVPMLGELINCPYCMAHWTAMPFAYALSSGFWMTLLNLLIITGLSSLFIGILLKLFLFREAENEELRVMLREAREVINDLAGE